MKIHNRKRITTLFITGFLMLFSLAPLSMRAEDTKTVRIGVPTDRCPISYVDSKTGKVTGIGIDLMTLAAENAGYTVEYTSLGNETLKDALDDDRYDIVMPFGSAMNSSAGHSTIFTKSLLDSPMVFAIEKGKSLNTEGSIKIGMLKHMEGLAQSVTDTYPNYEVVYFDSWDEAFNAVRLDTIDCCLQNAYVWTYILQKPSYSDIETLPAAAISMAYYAGATLTGEHAEIIDALNKGIGKITPTQSQSIILNYTSKSLYQYSLQDYYYEYNNIIWSVCLFILVIIGVAIWYAKQRRKYLNHILFVNEKLEESAKEESRLREKADDANKAKSEFLSRMSHDIRTPLNGIIGLTYLAEEQDNPEKTKEYLGKIDTSSKFLLGLVNEILDLSKAESGKTEVHPEPYYMVDFEHYIDSVIRPLVEQKNQTLTFDAKAVDGVVPLIDILLINQIYFNLLSNAVKYTPDGGTIQVILREKLIENHKIQVTVNVKDNGIGISKEFQKRVFEPFTQEVAKGQVERHGTGLGLAIVKRNVDILGGTITVNSEPGKGTEFTFVICYDYIQGSREKPLTENKIFNHLYDELEGKHILVCEDNHLNQEIVRTLLEEKKVIVEVVENGELGLEQFRNSTPDYWNAILMDIHMPVMDGYEATRQIRSLNREDAKTVKIIAMTADAFTEDIQKCINAGMNGHIAKPVDPERLYQTLAEQLEHSAGNS